MCPDVEKKRSPNFTMSITGMFLKVAQKVIIYLDNLVVKKLVSPKTLKNRPVWSHCRRRRGLSCQVHRKIPFYASTLKIEIFGCLGTAEQIPAPWLVVIGKIGISMELFSRRDCQARSVHKVELHVRQIVLKADYPQKHHLFLSKKH